MTGKLILCSTPIGNLEDVSIRMLRSLHEAHIVAAEDTRNTQKLLNAFGIKKYITSYHEHNKKEKGPYLVEKMLDGIIITLVTDAGSPGISDPGEDLVRQAREAGIEVTVVPGPCACIAALSLSGQSTRRFVFEGFLPRAKKEQKQVLDSLKTELRTTVLYEAPHRLLDTLQTLLEALGNRSVTICKELTKAHENTFLFTLSTAIEYFSETPPKGEFVIVLAGADKEEIVKEERKKWDAISLQEHLDIYLSQGVIKNDAIKQVAKDRGVPKRDVYQALLE